MPRMGAEAKGRCARHSHLAQTRAGEVTFRGETNFQINTAEYREVREGTETVSRTTVVIGIK